MNDIKPLLLPILFILFLSGCKDDITKYDRPDWLAGKVYTQVLEQPDLSTFARCIELTGYDEILDVSGSYTIFAPSDEAFSSYFAANPLYNSVEDIPIPELERIVKYHIVQNPWSKIQLRTLDIYGWIDSLDINNNEPKGFKRETLLLEKDSKYGISSSGIGKNKRVIIVDTLETNWHRIVSTDSRKFAPFFYQEYFDIYDLKPSDYEFYFNRSFDGGNSIYFANAKIVSDEIPAENGFVYKIDQVVEPLGNAEQIVSEMEEQYQYSEYFDILNLFPEFRYNEEKTLDQPGADQGIQVDSLFDLNFPDLTFDFTSERTSPPTGTYGLPPNVTIRYHHGLMAPTNQAFEKFVDDYIKIPNGWGTFNGTPEHIKRIVANTYMSVNTIYPTDFEKGFYNGEQDIVTLDEANIVQKEFGSNTTFIGLSEAIVPRAFKSVTGPVYLQRGYSKVMYAIQQSGLLPALKRQNQNYSFFVESDANTALDSSLIYYPTDESFSVFQVSGGGAYTEYPLNVNELRTLLLNHVAVDQPNGLARKEFIFNIAGNILTFNNETGEVSGTGTTTVGFRGAEPAPEFPKVLSDVVDNGTTYDIQNWFSFVSSSLYSKISSSYPKFHNLLVKAGLADTRLYAYNFISDNDFYTVFVPSDEALDSAKVNDLPVEELRNLLLFHFIQGSMIFTDGKQPQQYYETARIDESSTEYTTNYTRMFIKPGVDYIDIPALDGSNYVEVVEADGTTNIITGVSEGTGQEVFPILYNNGVVHEIDKVLKVEELDTN